MPKQLPPPRLIYALEEPYIVELEVQDVPVTRYGKLPPEFVIGLVRCKVISVLKTTGPKLPNIIYLKYDFDHGGGGRERQSLKGKEDDWQGTQPEISFKKSLEGSKLIVFMGGNTVDGFNSYRGQNGRIWPSQKTIKVIKKLLKKSYPIKQIRDLEPSELERLN